MIPIVCEDTGESFNGNAEEAIAAGWRWNRDGWHAPRPGWERHTIGSRSHEFVAYDGGVDFDPVTLNYGGDR